MTTPAATQRARDLLSRLRPGETHGAEIGVWRGHMSAVLLRERPDLHLLMVDHWRGNPDAPEGYRPADMDYAHAAALLQTRFAAERRGVMHMPSVEAARLVTPGYLDFVFIDADHRQARSDIEAWLPTLRRGGLIGGHDYANAKGAPEGMVKEDVDAAAARYGWRVEFGCQTCWYVRLP